MESIGLPACLAIKRIKNEFLDVERPVSVVSTIGGVLLVRVGSLSARRRGWRPEGRWNGMVAPSSKGEKQLLPRGLNFSHGSSEQRRNYGASRQCYTR